MNNMPTTYKNVEDRLYKSLSAVMGVADDARKEKVLDAIQANDIVKAFATAYDKSHRILARAAKEQA